MPRARIVWNANGSERRVPPPEPPKPPQRERGLSAAEIVQELARLEPGEEPTVENWLIRCARVVDWDAEPAYGTEIMRAAVDTTIRYLKWTALIMFCAGMVVGAIITVSVR